MKFDEAFLMFSVGFLAGVIFLAIVANGAVDDRSAAMGAHVALACEVSKGYRSGDIDEYHCETLFKTSECIKCHPISFFAKGVSR
jgi:hypothetical protein